MLLPLLLVLVTSSVAHHSPHHVSSGAGELPHVDEPLPDFSEHDSLDGADFAGHGPIEDDVNIEESGLPREEESKEGDVEDSEVDLEENKMAGDDEEFSNDDANKADEEDDASRGGYGKRPFGIGLVFESPLMRHLTRYFKQLEDTMDRVFRHNLRDILGSRRSNGSTVVSESTDEEEDESGNKFVVHKTVVDSADGDANSSVVVKVLDNRVKRSNWMSKPVQ